MPMKPGEDSFNRAYAIFSGGRGNRACFACGIGAPRLRRMGLPVPPKIFRHRQHALPHLCPIGPEFSAIALQCLIKALCQLQNTPPNARINQWEKIRSLCVAVRQVLLTSGAIVVFGFA